MPVATQRVALILSLALNLFLACAIAGAAVMWTGLGAPRVQAARPPLRFAGDRLTPTHRAAFRAMLRAVNHDAAPIVQEARESRREAAMLFVQPAYDPRKVARALDHARQADIAVRTRLETAVVDFAAGLPVQERVSLADGLRRGGPLRQPNPAGRKPTP
jgi:uncharacterized membrane protein